MIEGVRVGTGDRDLERDRESVLESSSEKEWLAEGSSESDKDVLGEREVLQLEVPVRGIVFVLVSGKERVTVTGGDNV